MTTPLTSTTDRTARASRRVVVGRASCVCLATYLENYVAYRRRDVLYERRGTDPTLQNSTRRPNTRVHTERATQQTARGHQKCVFQSRPTPSDSVERTDWRAQRLCVRLGSGARVVLAATRGNQRVDDKAAIELR